MRLCDRDIEIWLNKGRLSITPCPPIEHINGVTIDVRLGNKFRIFNGYTTPFIDLSESKDRINASLDLITSDAIELADGEVFYLHPGELVLAITYEYITLPTDLVGWLDGRSSLARLGLMVHVTAQRIDPGWSGHIVLEILNAGKLPLTMYPGMIVGALSFELLTGPALRPYNCRRNAKYNNQHDVFTNRSYIDDN